MTDQTARDFERRADDATMTYFRKQFVQIMEASRSATTSEHITQISAALAKAQKDFKTPTKTKTASVYSKRTNKTFTYKYADLEDVMKCVRAPLADNGLAVTHLTQEFAGQVELVTMLIHESGEWFRSIYPVKADAERPQEMGSAMTYARRYSVSALLGIASEEDDDAQSAQEASRSAGSDTGQREAIQELDRRHEASQADLGPDLTLMNPDTGEIQGTWKRNLGGVRDFMRQLDRACVHSSLYWRVNGQEAKALAEKKPAIKVDEETLSDMVARLESMYGVQDVDDIAQEDPARVMIP